METERKKKVVKRKERKGKKGIKAWERKIRIKEWDAVIEKIGRRKGRKGEREGESY